MIEYIYKLFSVEKDINGGIVKANIRIIGKKDGKRATRAISVELMPNPQSDKFIPFELVTENNVIDWCINWLENVDEDKRTITYQKSLIENSLSSISQNAVSLQSL